MRYEPTNSGGGGGRWHVPWIAVDRAGDALSGPDAIRPDLDAIAGRRIRIEPNVDAPVVRRGIEGVDVRAQEPERCVRLAPLGPAAVTRSGGDVAGAVSPVDHRRRKWGGQQWKDDGSRGHHHSDREEHPDRASESAGVSPAETRLKRVPLVLHPTCRSTSKAPTLAKSRRQTPAGPSSSCLAPAGDWTSRFSIDPCDVELRPTEHEGMLPVDAKTT
jgi:hypothetical protein